MDVADCQGKSDSINGGKKRAIFEATEPVYFIYVYRGKQKYQEDAEFFVRAYYEKRQRHQGILLAKDDGKIAINMKMPFGSSLPT